MIRQLLPTVLQDEQKTPLRERRSERERALMKITSEGGFTLLEVLIVIAIIIVIAGIALPRFIGVQDDANEARARGDMRVLQTGLESYILNSNPSSLPVDADALETALEAATPRIVSEFDDFNDPFAAANTDYRYAASGDFYVMWSIGPDNGADITGINSSGVIQGGPDDDIYVSNGKRN